MIEVEMYVFEKLFVTYSLVLDCCTKYTTTVHTHLSIIINALAWKWLLFIFMKKDSSFHFFFSCRQVFFK